jgi:hypothetical protein
MSDNDGVGDDEAVLSGEESDTEEIESGVNKAEEAKEKAREDRAKAHRREVRKREKAWKQNEFQELSVTQKPLAEASDVDDDVDKDGDDEGEGSGHGSKVPVSKELVEELELMPKGDATLSFTIRQLERDQQVSSFVCFGVL